MKSKALLMWAVAALLSVVNLPRLTRGEEGATPPAPPLHQQQHPMTYMCRNGHLDAIAARSFGKSTVSKKVQNDEESSSAPPSLWEGAVGATNWLWGSLKQAVLAPPPSTALDDGESQQLQKISNADSDENELSSVQKMTAGYECKGYAVPSSSTNTERSNTPRRYPLIMGISERHQAQTATSNIHIFSGILSLYELRATMTSKTEGGDGIVAATKAHLLETLTYLHDKLYGPSSFNNSTTEPPLPTADTLDVLLNDTAATDPQQEGRKQVLRSCVLLIVPGGSYEKLSPFETNAIPLQVLGYGSILERILASSNAPHTPSTRGHSDMLPVVVQYRVRPVSPFSPAHDISQAVRFFERVKQNVGTSSRHQNAAIPTPEALGLTANFSVAIAGFSAGGHVVGTYLAKLNSPTNTLVKAAALIYPVISLIDGDLLHLKSRANLFSGTNIFEQSSTGNSLPTTQMVVKATALSPQQELVARAFSLELHPENFPPYVYLAHSREDSVVPVENSIQMFTSLVKHRKSQAALKRNRFAISNRSKNTTVSEATVDQQIPVEHQSYQASGNSEGRATNDVTLQIYTHGAHGRWLFTPRLAPTAKDAATNDWYNKLENWLSTVAGIA